MRRMTVGGDGGARGLGQSVERDEVRPSHMAVRDEQAIDAVARQAPPTVDGTPRPHVDPAPRDPEAFVTIRLGEAEPERTVRVDPELKRKLAEDFDRLDRGEQESLLRGIWKTLEELPAWTEMMRLNASFGAQIVRAGIDGNIDLAQVLIGSLAAALTGAFDLYQLADAVRSGAGKGEIFRRVLRVGLDAAIFLTPFAIPASIAFAVHDARRQRSQTG